MPKNPNKSKKINPKKIIYYGIIFICNLALLLAIITLIPLKFEPDQLVLFNASSSNNLKIIIFVIVFITYVSFIYLPIKKLADEKAIDRNAPPGDMGQRGMRGKLGDRAICNGCSDNICFKKMLYNITKTYNFWRQKKGKKKLSESYVIPNLYLQKKIKEQCNSKEFKDILDKYGSHNNNEGIYDYLFGLWTIWILIILSYKNGEDFITRETIHESEFDYNNTDKFNIDEFLDGIPDNIGTIKITKNFDKDNKDTLTITPVIASGLASGLAPNNPAQPAESPFIHLKKFSAWYWGADKNSKPQININEPSNNVDSRCYVCSNADICTKPGVDAGAGAGVGASANFGKIKIKSTNDFYKVWASDNALQDSNFNPFKKYGNKNVTILRAKEYIDENEHPYFKKYKPIGDIMINSCGETDIENCYPYSVINDNNPNILKNINKKSTTSPQTILVSGDIKPPISYTNIFSTKITSGINKNYSAFTVWVPRPPIGYECIGLVIDTRFYDDSPLQPSKELVACVPKYTFVTESSSISQEPSIEWDNLSKGIDDKLADPLILTNYTFNIDNKYIYNIIKPFITIPNLNITISNSNICKIDKSQIQYDDGSTEIISSQSTDDKYKIKKLFSKEYLQKINNNNNKYSANNLNNKYNELNKKIDNFYKDFD